ncbi:MAG: hypothetical protein IJA58_01905 [Lachnospiraceae bacterium]|nr:hypothetical protein [Lachnospiraceae bacterium]
MFGYITVNRPEMKVKEFERYRSFYCGLCHELRAVYGPIGQATLTYDMTFLVILLTGLYEPETKESECRCLVHPVGKHRVSVNEFSRYGAEMNLLLAYYNSLDKWNDEKKVYGLTAARVLKRKCRAIEKKYPRQAKAVRQSLEKLAQIEGGKEATIDEAARCTGELLAELFAYREDMWAETLRRVGFYLGKFIYLCDAWEDLEKDLEKGLFNPFNRLKDEEDFEKQCASILTSMMAECAMEFEKLPIVEEIEILRNILYSGVWMRYDATLHEKRQKKEEGQQ